MPADCVWFDERLEAWLDGDLDRADARSVKRHLDGCARCRREVALARSIRDRLRQTAMPECPQEVVGDPPIGRPGRGRRFIPALAAGLFAGALALGVVWQVTRTAGPGGPSDAELAEARAELKLALGYVAAAGRAAGRDVGGVLADDGVLRPIRSGLELKVKIPVPRKAHDETVESKT